LASHLFRAARLTLSTIFLVYCLMITTITLDDERTLALSQSPFNRLGQEEWKVLYYNIQVGAIFPCLLEGGSDNPDKSRCSPSPPRPSSHHPDRRGIILLEEPNPMSGVFRTIDPPSPHLPASVYPPPFGAGGRHTRWVESGWGGGGSIVRKTPDTALYSRYVSTL
jgi:hypothetical protein